VVLPRALVPSQLSAVEVLSGATVPAEALDLALLGTVLFLSGGVTRVMGTPGGEQVWFRAAMSAGNLHPIEIYVMSEAMGGVYHYDPLAHHLQLVRASRGASSEQQGVTVVLTGVPLRTCWKYGARGWRHLWWDAGTVVANMLSVSDAHGVEVKVITAFADSMVAEVVDCDGVDEVPLAVVRLGRGGPLWPGTRQLGAPAPSLPLSGRRVQMPQVVALQSAGTLGEPELGQWERAGAALANEVPKLTSGPGAPVGTMGTMALDRVEDVVLRRGSPRSFGPGPAPNALLTWALGAAARPARLDICPSGSLLATVVNVHDVEGFEPGTYRFCPDGGFEQQAAGSDARRLSGALCLGQQRAAEASWTGFHFAGFARPAARLGGRAHRAALLEAGIRAGMLSLSSCAMNGGATGMTFYDRQVQDAFGLATEPLLATSVGLRGSPPAPSGTPGRPAVLRARRPGR
jgi:SagB-type dehydrogenase family enzyme